jgi:ubiquinone/menaquinone biosynthesis C-methylase UbiE
MTELTDVKHSEREEHNKTYASLSESHLKRYTISDYVNEIGTPCYEDDGALSGDINLRFLERVETLLGGYDKTSVRILDYACGMGKLSVYLALKGYRGIEGFDLSDAGVAFGARLAELNGVADRMHLAQMDAENLQYPDASFDIVIGKAVLHHTIKYPATASELKRVLKPGGVAIFKENIGNNPLLRLARFVTMDVLGDHGDVNITSRMLRDYAADFSSVEIEAWNCAFMGKRLLWKPGKQAGWRKAAMRLLRKLDDATVHRSQYLREQLCGDSIFILRK